MSMFDRRFFLKMAAGTTVGIGLAPLTARAQSANNHVLLFVFLRGGADGVSFLQPASGTSPARVKYEAWRKATTRVTTGIPVAGGIAMHPALGHLSQALAANHLCFVPGAGGAVPNRSHFQQQDLLESGASNDVPRVDGILGRALGVMSPNDVLAGVALGSTAPYVLRRASGSSGLAVPNMRTFGKLTSTTHRADPDASLEARIRRLYVPLDTCLTGQTICEAGRQAADGVQDMTSVLAAAAPKGDLGADLSALIKADTGGRIRVITHNVGGWDTHINQGSDARTTENQFSGGLARTIEALAKFLKSFYDAAITAGIFSRVTVQVVTEFGRTAFENGNGGTDHGIGSVALVMSTGLRAKIAATGWFPNSATAPFYTQAESANGLPRLIEHRQIFAEVLRKKFGMSDANLAVALPGYTYDTSAVQLFT